MRIINNQLSNQKQRKDVRNKCNTMWDLNEESQGRKSGFIWVAHIAGQLIGAAWSCMFKKILRVGSGPAGKSVGRITVGRRQYRYLVFTIPKIQTE